MANDKKGSRMSKMKESEERLVAVTASQKIRNRELTVFEKKFLLFVQRGDVIQVRKILEQHKNNPRLDINCTDPLGRTALVVGIENENMELISLLLEYKATAGDALLHAISEEYVEAVDVLLQYEERVHEPGKPYSWEAVESNSASYTKDITPLILAAHRDNYEIIKLLLDRGASLPVPHDVRCACDECVVNSKEDCLRHSRARINAYRALSSPSLIVLSSKDPILTAFELSAEVKRLSTIENEFKIEYKELRAKLQKFATALLSHARASHELSVLLNYDPNSVSFEPESRMQLERLKLAIKFQQKSFVAHSSVQQLLASVWYEGMPGFRRKGPLGQIAEIGKLGIMFPVYCTAYLLAPESELGMKMKQPFIKFIAHSSCYSFFLMVLIMASQRAESIAVDFIGPDWLKEWMDDYNRRERGKYPMILETVTLIFIMGYIWSEIKELWDEGIINYTSDMWNVLDVIANVFYITWIAMRVVAWYLVQRELSLGYEPYIPREEWHPYDPMLISEGMLGAAIIFSILKLVHIFSINPHLGPLQISLGRMVFDIIKFFFIYTLVVFAFGCGMNQLLWYYAENDKNLCYSLPGEKPNPDADMSCEIWRRFANLFETSQSLFWASFGLVELYNFELNGIQSYTRFWAMLMFGSYSVINVVVLLNLLIAMMSNSYQIISERSDMEWKFARSKLWMKYFEEGDTLPPPFNIMPSTKLLRRFFGCTVKPPSVSFKIKENKSREAEYEKVTRSLVRRYVTNQQREAESKTVTEDDVNEVKQDIATFRYELFAVLKQNGMNLSSIHCEKDTGRKEREFERRLLKGFNIGLVQTVVGAVIRQGTGKKNFDILRKLTGKRGKAKRNWNAIVTAAKEKQSQIGSSHPSHSGSLKELRDRIMSEKELEEKRINDAPLTKVKLMAALARKARMDAEKAKADALGSPAIQKDDSTSSKILQESKKGQLTHVQELPSNGTHQLVQADVTPDIPQVEKQDDVFPADIQEEPHLEAVEASAMERMSTAMGGQINQAFQDDEANYSRGTTRDKVALIESKKGETAKEKRKGLHVRISLDELDPVKEEPSSSVQPMRPTPSSSTMEVQSVKPPQQEVLEFKHPTEIKQVRKGPWI